MDSICENDIEMLSQVMTSSLLQPALDTGITKCTNSKRHGTHAKKKRINKPWFDKDCETKRKSYLKLKKKLSKRRTSDAEMELKNAAKEYKHFIRKTTRIYFKNVHATLRNIRCDEPREYWRVIGQCTKNTDPESGCPLEDLANHFKDLNSGESVISEDERNIHQRKPKMDTSSLDQPFTEEEIWKTAI